MSTTFEVVVTPFNNEVTGSCFHVGINIPGISHYSIIVDCGLFQGKFVRDLNAYPFPRYFKGAERLFLTHNHVDHIGRIPELVRHNFNGKIHCTPLTQPMLAYAWEDCYKIEKTNAKIEGRNLRFQRKHITKAVRQVIPYAYNKCQKLNRYVKATYLPNAHILGAAMLLLEVRNPFENSEINILFSGDYNVSNPFVDIQDIPESVTQKPLHLITECTYGASSITSVREPVFEKNIINELKKGKQILIPVFACERGQIILSVLKRMQDNNFIDKSIPIFLDGTLFKQYNKYYSSIADKHFKEEMKEFMPANCMEINSSIDKSNFLNSTRPFILVSTGGMASFGPVVEYLKEFITNSRAVVHFTGYMAEGTRGRKIYEASQTGELVEIFGMLMEIRCKVYMTSEFSSHALPSDLLEFICKFENLKSLCINHGSKEARKNFAKLILDSGIKDEVVNLTRLGQYHFSPERMEKVHFVQNAIM